MITKQKRYRDSEALPYVPDVPDPVPSSVAEEALPAPTPLDVSPPANTWITIKTIHDYSERARAGYDEMYRPGLPILRRAWGRAEGDLITMTKEYEACDEADPIFADDNDPRKLHHVYRDAIVAQAAITRSQMQPHQAAISDILNMMSQCLRDAEIEWRKRDKERLKAQHEAEYNTECDKVYSMWLRGKERHEAGLA